MTTVGDRPSLPPVGRSHSKRCWRKAILFPLSALFLVTGLFLSPAHTEDSGEQTAAFVPLNAQRLIDRCWDISLELRSGSTTDARFGFIESLTCLRKTIVEQIVPMMEPGDLTPAYAEWMLIEMAGPYAEFFDELYTAHKHCDCGTVNANIDVWAVTQLYEMLLRDVIDQRNKLQI